MNSKLQAAKLFAGKSGSQMSKLPAGKSPKLQRVDDLHKANRAKRKSAKLFINDKLRGQ